MLRQYLQTKNQYPDCIIFFRLGDFYEMFFEDAQIASKLLGITLTSRAKGKDAYPMCGVPFFSAGSYIAKLVEQGHKVAVCDQVEDASSSKGIVKREVTRVVSPGMITNPEDLDAKLPNFLAGLSVQDTEGSLSIGFAFLDVSTADFRATQITSQQMLMDEIARVRPKELLLPAQLVDSNLASELRKRQKGLYIRPVDDESPATLQPNEQFAWVTDLPQGNPSGGSPDLGLAYQAAATVYRYAYHFLPGSLSHIRRLVTYQVTDHMVIDDYSQINLELACTLMDAKRQGSLLDQMDRTQTPMGARTLTHWLLFPLISIDEIQKRLAAVESLFLQDILREDLAKHLGNIRDMERLVAKISLGQANPRDLGVLRDSLDLLPAWQDLILSNQNDALKRLLGDLDLLQDLYQELDDALVASPPPDLAEGGAIRTGYNPELDRLFALATKSRDLLANLEETERQKTGIGSLKVRYNRVFGYYLEVTKTHLKQVPSHYQRKQTTANAERYETQELKELEESILRAQDERVGLEREIINHLMERIRIEAERILKTAKQVAISDVIASLACLARDNHYNRPQVDDSEIITIEDGRHPVVEAALNDERFVPNDIQLDCNQEQLLLITGPNMAGKSTTIRQVALICIMAQMGSFVPAKAAHIGVVDRIFTRIGASDNLARGHSTFMIEMLETANILNNATRRSLLILDEVGRGTSTFDGLSIAWATAEYIHDRIMARTLFATHYHQLTDLVKTKERIANYTMSVKEWRNQIIFLRRLVKGACNRSYGIQVARLAGLPGEVIQRAKELLVIFEKEESKEMSSLMNKNTSQLLLFHPTQESPTERELKETDLDSITPLEALQLLHKLKNQL